MPAKEATVADMLARIAGKQDEVGIKPILTILLVEVHSLRRVPLAAICVKSTWPAKAAF